MKTASKIKRIVGIIGFAVALLLVLWLLQKLLVPKYVSDVREGNLISEYYASDKDHDVIFIGDSDVYHSFSPLILWDEYGISSYIRGSAGQTVAQSYYIMEETLCYEKPKVFVFNIFAMQTDIGRETYNRMTVDGMKWSSSKSGAVKASMTADETYISYLFPILRFHDRWEELDITDVQYLFTRPRVSVNGYLERKEVVPVSTLPDPVVFHNIDFSNTNYRYLDSMVELCRDNGIELILVKAPALYPYWYDEWEQRIDDYARVNGLTYINFLDDGVFEQTELDFSTDTCDGGLHLNCSGAEKLSIYFGRLLRDEHGVPDRSDNVLIAESYSRLFDAAQRSILGVTPVPSREPSLTPTATPAAVTTNAPEAPIEQTAPPKGVGYSFRFEGVDIYTDVDCDKLLVFLPSPVDSFVAPSCGAQGDSYIYTYDSLQLETYPDGGINRIAYITLMDDTVATPEGVDLTFAKEDIIGVYGTPSIEEDFRLVYKKDGMGLVFGFRNDTLIEIRYVSGSFL